MALTASIYGGSAWRNVVMAAFHTVMSTTVGLKSGLPISMRTRSIPLHLPTILTEAKDGVLLDTFDSIPLYTLGAAVQNKLECQYPDGTWVAVTCVQE